jgi:histidine triad (HIT) family protein
MSYDDNNVFARILRGELPCHRVHETDRVLAFMDVMPRGKGHVLVIPKAQARNIFDISESDLGHVIHAVQLISRAVVKAFKADGVSIIQSNERAGGQVVFHMHVHVIPRWNDLELGPQNALLESSEVLMANAEKLRHALGVS